MEFLRTAYQVSIRRACRVLCAAKSSYHYKSREDEQAALRQRIREIAETRVRYGYRRIHVLLQREGWRINHKRTYRLYCEEGLQMRNKTPKHAWPNDAQEPEFSRSFRCKDRGKSTTIVAILVVYGLKVIRSNTTTLEVPPYLAPRSISL